MADSMIRFAWRVGMAIAAVAVALGVASQFVTIGASGPFDPVTDNAVGLLVFGVPVATAAVYLYRKYIDRY